MCLCVLVILALSSAIISFAGIIVFGKMGGLVILKFLLLFQLCTGGLGIENAKVENDERYISAYCNAEDNSDYVWTFWMTGSTVAAILFWLLGTTTIIVGLKLARSVKTNSRYCTTYKLQ